MKITSVQVKNIRQFVGSHEIEFSTSDKKNVTLVHGPNTSGKTTLLNAIKWCLYGTFLRGFADPERLVSKQTPGAEYGVTIRFSHAGKNYLVSRHGKNLPSNAVLTVLVEQTAGRQVPHPEPQLLINQILPESLSPFFFFAGEMISDGRGAFKSNQTTAEAIRAVLGFTVAETAIADLGYIQKKKNSELAALSKGTDLGDVSAALVEKTETLELVQKQLVEARGAFRIFEQRKQEISDELRGLESSSALQHKRDRAETQRRGAEDQLRKARRAWRENIASHGHTAFWTPIASEARRYIDDAITKRRIPSPYDKTFVSDLLNDKLCVCGRELIPGTKEFRCVSDLINDATDEQTIRRAMAVRGIADKVSGLFETTSKQFQRTAEVLRAATDSLENTEQELARLRDLMKKQTEKNVAAREEELERVEKQLVEFKVRVARHEEDIERAQVVISDLKKQRDRIQAASPQVEAVKRSIDIISRLIERLKDELELAERAGIDQISAALNKVVSNSTRRKYVAQVASDYTVALYDGNVGGDRQKVQVLSSGEHRLVNLCFVSALVKVCRDRQHDKNGLLTPGAVAPLVIDAPFGELDPEYQSLAVATMIDQADQLVLFLSKTHRTSEVDQTIRPKLGKEWILVASHTAEAGGAADVEIEVAGKNYKQMLYGQSVDKTEFVSVGA